MHILMKCRMEQNHVTDLGGDKARIGEGSPTQPNTQNAITIQTGTYPGPRLCSPRPRNGKCFGRLGYRKGSQGRLSPRKDRLPKTHTHPRTKNMSARLPIEHRPLGGRALRHQLLQPRTAMAIDHYLSPSPWQPGPPARRGAQPWRKRNEVRGWSAPGGGRQVGPRLQRLRGR